MTITHQVILDLLPLYTAGEASEDSIKLIEDYLMQHPEFAARIDSYSAPVLPETIPLLLKPEDEMTALKKTRWLLKLRAAIFGFALFFSLLPFTFGEVSFLPGDGVRWLWRDFPTGAVLSGLLGLAGWIGYIVLQKRLSASAL